MLSGSQRSICEVDHSTTTALHILEAVVRSGSVKKRSGSSHTSLYLRIRENTASLTHDVFTFFNHTEKENKDNSFVN
ncbi:hypothetical protein NPIL_84481 [Nephila pilipes]|uniref:Uncharacterized protein n=1 Tax=Nephila pilipes TaxID=299642 RepID=A0A8X6MCJ7_NEPPI|nr:hypothetical protein NPIL_84481 [Nephila pilipes]